MSTTSNRKYFLTFASVVALGVGSVALIAPETLLASKGVTENAAAAVWTREVGGALVALGFIAWCVRAHPNSPTLRAFMLGNAVLQLLLLPVEVLAYSQGAIINVWGIVPNSVLHVPLGLGFVVNAPPIAPPTAPG